MKSYKRIVSLFLAMLCIASLFLTACEKSEEPLPETRTITVRKEPIIHRYIGRDVSEFRTDMWSSFKDHSPPTAGVQLQEVVITPDDPRYESGETVFSETYDFFDITLALYPTVIDWLEGDPTVERHFLLRPEGMEHIYKEDAVRRDAFFEDWAGAVLPEQGLPEVVSRVGFVSWWGTHTELLALRDLNGVIWACFVDDFESIYGMPIEKAQELIDAGELDIWSCPVAGSPLYNKTPDEIAAYLAAQEQQ